MIAERSSLRFALLIAALTLLSAACGEEEFEFQQSLGFTGTLGLSDVFQAEAGEPVPFDDEASVALGVDFLLTELSPELKPYKDQGLFTQLRFDQIKYEILENTLTTDLEALDVAVGPLGTKDPDAEAAVLIATLPRIEAGQLGTGEATILRENAAAASKFIFDLDFASAAGTIITVRQGEPTPGGNLKIKIDMTFTLVADPL